MEYSIQKLARLAGVSSRTLRYYDEIDLLKPARISSSGYRIYSQVEVDRLQQILFYRELGLGLEQIRDIVNEPSFNDLRALAEHRSQLLDRRKQLDTLIATVERTIAMKEGRISMSDEQKFEGFKQQMIQENEEKYGQEIREKYGDQAVEQSNAKLSQMTPQQYEEVTRLAEEVMTSLRDAFNTGDPAGELAQKTAELHKQWLSFYWNQYSKEAHAGVAEMYVADERFKAYYDKDTPGMAEFLRDAIQIYAGMKE
ncbi:HTH-type transcriptional activator TipA [compost metagenome]